MTAHVVKQNKKSVDKLVLETKCYIAKLGDNLYNSLIYGSCSSNTNVNLYKKLQLLLYAVEGNCLSEAKKNKIGSKISTLIELCKPKKERCLYYTTQPENYDAWYASPGYLECLAYSLTQGCVIDPLVDITEGLDINITVQQLCNIVAASIIATQVDCNIDINIEGELACDVLTQLNVTSACETILANIVLTSTLGCTVITTIEQLSNCMVNLALENGDACTFPIYIDIDTN